MSDKIKQEIEKKIKEFLNLPPSSRQNHIGFLRTALTEISQLSREVLKEIKDNFAKEIEKTETFGEPINMKQLPEKLNIETLEDGFIKKPIFWDVVTIINQLIDYLKEREENIYTRGAGGCCEECEIYLDYKDDFQCNNRECKCHFHFTQ